MQGLGLNTHTHTHTHAHTHTRTHAHTHTHTHAHTHKHAQTKYREAAVSKRTNKAAGYHAVNGANAHAISTCFGRNIPKVSPSSSSNTQIFTMKHFSGALLSFQFLFPPPLSVFLRFSPDYLSVCPSVSSFNFSFHSLPLSLLFSLHLCLSHH